MENTPNRLLLHPLNHAPPHPLALNRLNHAPGQPLQHLLPLLVIAGIGQQRRNQHRPRRRKGPPRRPNMQRRDMPMPHILLMDRVEGRLLEGKGDFDETGGGHVFSPNSQSLRTRIGHSLGRRNVLYAFLSQLFSFRWVRLIFAV